MEKKEVWRYRHPLRQELVAKVLETDQGRYLVAIGKEFSTERGTFLSTEMNDWDIQLMHTMLLKAQGALLRLQEQRPAPMRQRQEPAQQRPVPRAMAETTAHNTTTAMAPLHQGAISFDDDDVPNF